MAEFLKSREALLRRFPQDAIGAELGVEWGSFSRRILDIAKPREFWLIDAWRHLTGPFEGDPVNHDDQRFEEIYQKVSRELGGFPQVRILRGLLHDACQGFPAGYFDWIYLDACHAKECVEQDLNDWWPLLKTGGIFAGHDYWRTDGYPWIEVKQAVDEFCNTHNLTLRWITDEPCGSWAIVKEATVPIAPHVHSISPSLDDCQSCG